MLFGKENLIQKFIQPIEIMKELINLDMFKNANYVLAKTKYETKIGVLLYGEYYPIEYSYKVVFLSGYDQFNYYISIDNFDSIQSIELKGLFFNNRNSNYKNI